jgi:hypothetical protein
VRGASMSSDTSKVKITGTCNYWQDEQSDKVNALLVRPLTSITTYIYPFSIPVYLPLLIAIAPSTRTNDPQTWKPSPTGAVTHHRRTHRVPRAGEAIRITVLCSRTGPPSDHWCRQCHSVFCSRNTCPDKNEAYQSSNHNRANRTEQNTDVPNTRAEMSILTRAPPQTPHLEASRSCAHQSDGGKFPLFPYCPLPNCRCPQCRPAFCNRVNAYTETSLSGRQPSHPCRQNSDIPNTRAETPILTSPLDSCILSPPSPALAKAVRRQKTASIRRDHCVGIWKVIPLYKRSDCDRSRQNKRLFHARAQHSYVAEPTAPPIRQ